MRHFSHLNTATKIVQQYEGKGPLHLYLKSFFSQHKKFGSKDRKRISHLCYLYYRVARGFGDAFENEDSETIQQKILTGLFLCSYEDDELLAAMKPDWNDRIALGVLDKVAIIQKEIARTTFNVKNIYPSNEELSNGINEDLFILSHFDQPDLFIRVRPGQKGAVIEKLKSQEVLYEWIPESAIRLPNGYKVQDHFALDKEIVVQDLSSQQVGDLIKSATDQGNVQRDSSMHKQPPIVIWDCCAASGGKSIMAKDILGAIDLTVSDVRKSILINLKKRFETAGINSYKSFIADLSSESCKPGDSVYDLIIADLPCTGSGTWSRTPEQLYFFQPDSVANYNRLQRKILDNTIPHLKETGKLLYVTCSVFKKENEDVIEYIVSKFQLKVERMQLLKGYDSKADTIFAASLSRLH